MVEKKKPKTKPVKTKLAPGRPSIYTEELASRICEIVATNPVGLPTLCKMFPEIPSYETINVWRWNKPGFADRYAEAKRLQAEIMVESCEDIILDMNQFKFIDKDGARRLDSGLVAQSRLLVDTRKWHAAKLAPKIYGDRMQVETKSENIEALKVELLELRAKLADKSQSQY